MERKFGRRLQDRERYGFDFSLDFEVESYLRYQGKSFVERFDANSMLYLTKALDYFDLSVGHQDLTEAFRATKGLLPADSIFVGLALSAGAAEIRRRRRCAGRAAMLHITKSAAIMVTTPFCWKTISRSR